MSNNPPPPKPPGQAVELQPRQGTPARADDLFASQTGSLLPKVAPPPNPPSAASNQRANEVNLDDFENKFSSNQPQGKPPVP